MKILKEEVVTRYCVQFTPLETLVLREHPEWRLLIGYRLSGGSDATLTKTQINGVLDVLGVNGREFMRNYGEHKRGIGEQP